MRYFLSAAVLSILFANSVFAETFTKQELIDYIVQEAKLPESFVAPNINGAKYKPELIEKMKTPYEARPYVDYRPLFVNERMKQKARVFLEKNHDIFVEAQAKYGVAPEVITAILGIETRFGENWGRDKVLDALVTLSMGYERRAKFFRKELKAFLILCNEENIKPSDIEGSYAGAFGVTQLMPSSFLMYAVDGNNDGKRDVWHTPKDIIFSVANYFNKHKWDDSKRVAHWVEKVPNSEFIKQALKEETRNYQEMALFEAQGIPSFEGWATDEKVALIRRETSTGVRTLLVNRNFHAITRWNRSWNYALATTELAYMLGNEKCDVGK